MLLWVTPINLLAPQAKLGWHLFSFLISLQYSLSLPFVLDKVMRSSGFTTKLSKLPMTLNSWSSRLQFSSTILQACTTVSGFCSLIVFLAYVCLGVVWACLLWFWESSRGTVYAMQMLYCWATPFVVFCFYVCLFVWDRVLIYNPAGLRPRIILQPRTPGPWDYRCASACVGCLLTSNTCPIS